MAKRPDIDQLLFCLSLLAVQSCVMLAGPRTFGHWFAAMVLAAVVGIVSGLRIAGRSNQRDINANEPKPADGPVRKGNTKKMSTLSPGRPS